MEIASENVVAFMVRSIAELAVLSFVLGVAFVCLAPSAWF